jgi:hypothetical protein
MNTLLKRFFCLIAFQFMPATAFAVAGWTSYASVVELNPASHERFQLELKVVDNPSGCKNKVIFYQDYNGTGSELMFSTLLEAVASNKRVRVFVTGNCELNGYSEISSVGIVP